MSLPAKLLKVAVTMGSRINSRDTLIGTTYVPTAWNVTLNVTPQQHSDPADPNKIYNSNDVIVGDWIATQGYAKALQITSITSVTSNIVVCVAEDIDNINAKMDSSGYLNGSLVNGDGVVFEVKNGVPVLYPIPPLSTTIDKAFSAQLMSRFISSGGGVIGVPEALTIDDLGDTVASLDNNHKLTSTQIPSNVVLTNDSRLTDARNPLTHTHNYIPLDYIGASNGVPPLVQSKVPVTYLPDSFGNFEVVTSLPDTGDVNKFYILQSDSSVWKWTGNKWIKVSSDGTVDTSYNFITVSESDLIDGEYQSVDNQIITVLTDCTIILPDPPETGNELILLNNSNFTIILTTSKDINGNNNYPIANVSNDYNISTDSYSTYLVYTSNGWQFSSTKQLVNIYTQQPGSDQYGPSDYWPAGTVHTINDSAVIFGKPAIVENWTLTNSNIVYVIKIKSETGNNVVDAYLTSVDGWNPNDKIKIFGASGTGINNNNAAVLNSTNNTLHNSDYWEITSIDSEHNKIRFYIDNDLKESTEVSDDSGAYFDNIGTMIKITEEPLSEQVTIFEPSPSDNFSTIWFPKSGLALQRDVTFNERLNPSMVYSYNLLVSISRILGIDWKTSGYSTFNEYISNTDNFSNIRTTQAALDLIASKPDFLRQYINSNISNQFTNPAFGTSNSLTYLSKLYTVQSSKSTIPITDDAYKAFDRSLATNWTDSSLGTRWLKFTLHPTQSLFPHSFTIYTGSGNSPKSVTVEYYLLGAEPSPYQFVGEFPLSNDVREDTFYILKANIASSIWRFTFNDSWGGTNAPISITDIKIRGWLV